jgi:hypothetical protein
MSNITKVEQRINDLKLVNGVHGSLMASLVWSYSASLASAIAVRARMDHPDDNQFTRLRSMPEADKLTRLKRQDQRITEISSIISWAKEEATPDFLPTGESVIALVTKENNAPRVTPEEEIKTFATTMGVTIAEATAAFEGNAKQNLERQELTRQAILRDQKYIANEIDAALRFESGDFELSDYDAARILEKVASKCDQYEQQRLQQAAGTRRAKRLADLGAERRLLIDVMNKADTLADQMATDAENNNRAAFLSSTATETMEDKQPDQATA